MPAPPPSELDRPSSLPWPPILLALSVAVALSIDRWLVPLPVPFAERVAVQISGWIVLMAGAGIAVWAALAFRDHKTTIRPDRPAAALIERGPYAWSRNPIYLGEAVALVGASLAFNRMSLILVAPLFLGLVWRLAVRPEEAYLERAFGDRYRSYRDRVGRWI